MYPGLTLISELATLVCTVVLSVVLHGVSANPLARRIGRAAAA
jgi:hypothetical protein